MGAVRQFFHQAQALLLVRGGLPMARPLKDEHQPCN